MSDAGAVGSTTGRREYLVDGFTPEENGQVLTLLLGVIL
jgi:hypothetical protein